MDSIWTLNGRDSIQLDLVRDYFNLHDSRMRREILVAHAATTKILQDKGIEYSGLRKALTPQIDRLEACFIFDTESGGQSVHVADALIPLLDRRSSCSILCGDLLHPDQDAAFLLLSRHLHLHRNHEISHTTQLYCVYINNLSKKMFEDIHVGLQDIDAYVGYVPTTFSSDIKDWLSFTLTAAYLKSGRRVVNGHESDVSNDEDYNMKSWPFEKYGYEIRSLQEHYFDLFLRYKIERAVLPYFKSDTRHSLNAISDAPMALTDLSVLVDEEKIGYLRDNKGGSIKRAGLAGMSGAELASLIKSKITCGYIYNLRHSADLDQSFFNLILETHAPDSSTRSRLTVGLEYRPDQHDIRLITMF